MLNIFYSQSSYFKFHIDFFLNCPKLYKTPRPCYNRVDIHYDKHYLFSKFLFLNSTFILFDTVQSQSFTKLPKSCQKCGKKVASGEGGSDYIVSASNDNPETFNQPWMAKLSIK